LFKDYSSTENNTNNMLQIHGEIERERTRGRKMEGRKGGKGRERGKRKNERMKK
jgi:hypothetical protein